MLEERTIKPDLQGRKRACFRGDWLEAQLTYDKRGAVEELFVTYLAPYRAIFALIWSKAKGYAHHRILYDSGGSEIVTCPDAQYLGSSEPDLLDQDELRGRIFVGTAQLNKKVRELLLKMIDGYPTPMARCPYCTDVRAADCKCDCGKRACIPCARKKPFLDTPCRVHGSFHRWLNLPNSD